MEISVGNWLYKLLDLEKSCWSTGTWYCLRNNVFCFGENNIPLMNAYGFSSCKEHSVFQINLDASEVLNFLGKQISF